MVSYVIFVCLFFLFVCFLLFVFLCVFFVCLFFCLFVFCFFCFVFFVVVFCCCFFFFVFIFHWFCPRLSFFWCPEWRGCTSKFYNFLGLFIYIFNLLQTPPHYTLEESNFNFRYVWLWEWDILRVKWLNYRQTVENLIRRRRTRRLIWVCTVCELPF